MVAVASPPKTTAPAKSARPVGALIDKLWTLRESRRKPREEAPAAEPVDADLLAALRERIAELTAENEALRAEIAQLKATSA